MPNKDNIWFLANAEVAGAVLEMPLESDGANKSLTQQVEELGKSWKESPLPGGQTHIGLVLGLFAGPSKSWEKGRVKVTGLHKSPDRSMLPPASQGAAAWLWKEGNHHFWFQLRQYCNLVSDLPYDKSSPTVLF